MFMCYIRMFMMEVIVIMQVVVNSVYFQLFLVFMVFIVVMYGIQSVVMIVSI